MCFLSTRSVSMDNDGGSGNNFSNNKNSTITVNNSKSFTVSTIPSSKISHAELQHSNSSSSINSSGSIGSTNTYNSNNNNSSVNSLTVLADITVLREKREV